MSITAIARRSRLVGPEDTRAHCFLAAGRLADTSHGVMTTAAGCMHEEASLGQETITLTAAALESSVLLFEVVAEEAVSEFAGGTVDFTTRARAIVSNVIEPITWLAMNARVTGRAGLQAVLAIFFSLMEIGLTENSQIFRPSSLTAMPGTHARHSSHSDGFHTLDFGRIEASTTVSYPHGWGTRHYPPLFSTACKIVGSLGARRPRGMPTEQQFIEAATLVKDVQLRMPGAFGLDTERFILRASYLAALFCAASTRWRDGWMEHALYKGSILSTKREVEAVVRATKLAAPLGVAAGVHLDYETALSLLRADTYVGEEYLAGFPLFARALSGTGRLSAQLSVLAPVVRPCLCLLIGLMGGNNSRFHGLLALASSQQATIQRLRDMLALPGIRESSPQLPDALWQMLGHSMSSGMTRPIALLSSVTLPANLIRQHIVLSDHETELLRHITSN